MSKHSTRVGIVGPPVQSSRSRTQSKTSGAGDGKGGFASSLLAGFFFVFWLLLPMSATAQEPQKLPSSAAAEASSPPGREPAPLAQLIEEAERNNPQILAARHAWQAATQLPSQLSTLPDPQFTLQQFSVGSPRPFAGYTNSDFAYIGRASRRTSRIPASCACAAKSPSVTPPPPSNASKQSGAPSWSN
jgi:hypothetical protein